MYYDNRKPQKKFNLGFSQFIDLPIFKTFLLQQNNKIFIIEKTPGLTQEIGQFNRIFEMFVTIDTRC